MFGRLTLTAVTLAALAVAAALTFGGCEPMRLFPTTQPDTAAVAATRPDESAGPTPTTRPEAIEPPSATQPAVEPVSPPVAVATTQPAAAVSVDPSVPVGVPSGLKVEFTMPGMGKAPLAGEANGRLRAACQAAIFAAIYNVTKELNTRSYNDKIEGGFVNSDHFRYNAGLEVKSQLVFLEGRVTQFDIWLIVPAGPGPGAGRIEAHVQNFVLASPPLSQQQLDRLLRSAGGHLAVLRLTGPDPKGFYHADVGLIRKAK